MVPASLAPALKRRAGELERLGNVDVELDNRRIVMGFGRGILLWLIGIPIPIIILIALFWHH
jgi:hypothetical protein